jgi:tetratricopeptide (TPR) repeat protein
MPDPLETARRILLLAVSILAAGCITTAPRSRPPGNGAQVVSDIPVRQWGDNSCGGGALSTVLNHFGDPVTETELDERLDKGRNGGVVSIDLLLEARARGFTAELVAGTEATVEKSVSDGKPVMLMLRVVDLPRRNRDLFHYIVIDGIDTERDLVRMQWGKGKPRWSSLASIKRAWSATGHATIIVHGRSESRATPEELLRRAVLLQEKGKAAEAVVIYEELARSAPSPLVYTNLGNARRESGDAVEAEAAYRAALVLEPANRDALNNLAWHLLQLKRASEAAFYAREAAKIEGSDHDLILDTLADVESALGRCGEAIGALAAAVKFAPDARRPAAENKLAETSARCHSSDR